MEEELQSLIKLSIEGDRAAFEKLYEYTKDDVYRTVSFLVFNKDDVQDLVSEIYIKLLKSLPNYDLNRPFWFWLHGLIVRQVQDWRRKIWRRLHLFDKSKDKFEMPSEVMKIDQVILQKETRNELVYLVQKLSYKLRVVIILRYFHDYHLDEIASLLNIPVGTVKSRHHLAIKKLREKYEVILQTREESVPGVN